MPTPNYLSQIQTASYNGVAFSVHEVQQTFARRYALHTYFAKDDIFAEDLGMGRRMYEVQGFVSGDNVFSDRDSLVSALKSPDAGSFVHPTLGNIECVVLSTSFSETINSMGCVEFRVTFLEASTTSADTSSAIDTGSVVGDAADDLDDASGDDFWDDISDGISDGYHTVKTAVHTVTSYANQVRSVVGDATRVVNSVTGLASILPAGVSLGRYQLGNISKVGSTLSGINQALSVPARLNAGVSNMLSMATTVRTTVGNLADKASSAFGAL